MQNNMMYLDIVKDYEGIASFKDFIAWIAEYSLELQDYKLAMNDEDEMNDVDVMKFFQNDMYMRHKVELSGIFTLNEATAIISLFQTYPSWKPLNNNKDVLIWKVEDGITYESLVERLGIDKERILEKLKKLNEEQSATVIIMAVEFWISTCEDSQFNSDVAKQIFMVS